MTDPMETMLRETFAADADSAPPAAGLARAARGRLRRRRVRAASGLAAVAVVAVAGGVAWQAATPEARSGPPAVRVEPQPPEPVEGAYTAAEERVIGPLRRPLNLPEPAPGAPCPTTATRQLPAGGGFSAPFPALGPGPFVLTGGPDVEVSPAGSGPWSEGKVIWAVEGGYPGPVLIRGARIDAPGELGLVRYLGALGQTGMDDAHPDLAYPAQDTGELVTYPSGIRVSAPGCYAVQVDGTSFSQVLTFRVRAR